MPSKAELQQTLLLIDEEFLLTYGTPNPKPTVVIVGGSAFMLLDLTNRPATADIDVLQTSDLVRSIMSSYPLANERVSAYLDQIPYNFEDRLIEIPLETSAIRFMTPSLEDLAVMKLYAWRQNDIADLTSPKFLKRLNWDLLDRLVNDPDESLASALSERRFREMRNLYEQYREAYRK